MKRPVKNRISFAALFVVSALATGAPADDGGNSDTTSVRNGLVADNLTRPEYQAVLDALNRFDFQVEDFHITVVADEPRYRVELSRGLGPAWRIRSNLTKQQLDSLSEELAGQGYAVRKHLEYTIKNQKFHAVLFVKSDSGAGSVTAGVQGG